MLPQAQKIFIIGIKGVAMANLALILSQMAKSVSGSDVAESFITDELLSQNNIQVITSFSPDALPQGTDLVIYAASHDGLHNPQVVEAKKRGITVMHQAVVIGELMKGFVNSIAICGCHGKTTTTSLTAYALKQLDLNPSFLIGTSTFSNGWAGEFCGLNYFVVEADEYGMSPPDDKTVKFLQLNPTHILATNIDFDHPDVYSSIEDVKKTFQQFFQKSNVKKIVACGDDENIQSVLNQIDRSKAMTYGFSQNADVKITNMKVDETGTSFELVFENNSLGTFKAPLFGDKIILNIAGVIILLHNLGIELDKLRTVFDGFSGVKRRFEKVGEVNSFTLFDDYAHHPEEIKATIAAARSRFPQRRVIVIFQSHTYSRTESLKDAFVFALSKADYAFISPIFPSARETVTENSIKPVDLENYAKQKGIENVLSFTTDEELNALLTKYSKKGDVIFTMGAGDVYKRKDDIIRLLEKVN